MIRREPVQTFADHRGTLFKVWPGPVTGEVYAVELRPGHPRGFHTHTHGGEWFSVLRGKVWLVAEDLEAGTRSVLRLEQDRVYVPAGIAHALFCDEPSLVLAIAEVHFDHELTTRCTLAAPTEAERQATP